MGYAAFDDETTQTILSGLSALRSEAEAYAAGARALAVEALGSGAAAERAGRGLTATAAWCADTSRELLRRRLELGPASVPPEPAFAAATPAQSRGLADGKALATAIAKYRAGHLSEDFARNPRYALDPVYAAAVVTAIPPESLGWLATVGALPEVFALLGEAERAGALPAWYRLEVLALPSARLGPLLAATTFSTGFLASAVIALLVGKATEPLTPDVVSARVGALRAAAADPAAARALLTAPGPTERALRYAAGWPGLPPDVRAAADRAVGTLLRAGLAPAAGTSAEVSAAWRTVVQVIERDPDLVATHGAPARVVNRALTDAFAPFLPYVAWQGHAGPPAGCGPAPAPAFVPEFGVSAVARFLGRLLADRGALAGLRSAVLEYAGRLDLAGRLRLVPGTGEVVVAPGVSAAGWLLSGALGLLGSAAQNANLHYKERVTLQATVMGGLIGAVFEPIGLAPGGGLLVNLGLVPPLVEAFVEHRLARGPADGRQVLAETAAECADAVVRAVDLAKVPPDRRAAAAATIRAVVLATVLQPVLRVTDPGYRP